MPDLTILSPRLAQVIDATVTNGTMLDSPRIEVEAEPIDEPIKDPPASNWTNLFAKNRAATNGLNLEYIPPKMVDGKQIVELAQEEIDKELHKWNCSLIAYFIGETPGYKSMQRYVMQFWANAAQPDLYLHEVGHYIIRFQNKEDMQEVFYNGPYTINNKPIILKPWSINFDLSKEFPTEIPLWVKFPNLPMTCWSKDSLSRIASAVEVNVSNPLPDEITVLESNGRQIKQTVTYDWRLKFCPQCSVVGHCCRPKPLIPAKGDQKRQQATKKVTQEWKYKGVIPATTTNPSRICEDEQAHTPTQEPPGEVSNPSPEFNLTNFPVLHSIPLKNGFGSLICNIGGGGGGK
ncbi:hypothetical protein MTR67_013221 [Solanum verrucosum]|uniref:DUF4283 domain-containing protein n=1 Tax=Solanum verrucosum TaxID=315347 RepID=A0AAF0THR4_SOLVR|nr:hypothetical protein MTR67_013221 [Solanum verrucosum]